MRLGVSTWRPHGDGWIAEQTWALSWKGAGAICPFMPHRIWHLRVLLLLLFGIWTSKNPSALLWTVISSGIILEESLAAICSPYSSTGFWSVHLHFALCFLQRELLELSSSRQWSVENQLCVGSWIHPASISRPTFLLGKKWDVLWPSWSHMVWDFF